MSLGQQGNYEDLAAFQNCLLFQSVDAVNRIETSLICLVILTKQIAGREDLM